MRRKHNPGCPCCASNFAACSVLDAAGAPLYLTDANGTHMMTSQGGAVWTLCYLWTDPYSYDDPFCVEVPHDIAVGYRYTCTNFSAPTLRQQWQTVNHCGNTHTTPATFKYNLMSCLGTNAPNSPNTNAQGTVNSYDLTTSVSSFTIPIFPIGITLATVGGTSYTPFPGTVTISP